ncbi:unnamed protein product [Oreochromis niloticus]|nr:unnamed protein product [Mustela putorius furo]
MPRGQDKATSSAKTNTNNATGQACTSPDSIISDSAGELLKAIELMKTEMKQDNERLRQDINTLQQELGGKLDKIKEDIKTLSERMGEAEDRVGNIEDMTLELTEALIQSLTAQKLIQNKLADLESRSRRNNIRMFGVEEGAEGRSVQDFVSELLQHEILIPDGLELKIQGDHRIPTRKARPGELPRPILINFQEFTTKELILREVWKKKQIQVKGKMIYFDHDYAPDIVQKRKQYREVKRILKDAGVRFQTHFTSMRIHWRDGARYYSSARDAALELQRRGYDVQIPAESEEEDALIRRCREWKRVPISSREQTTSPGQRAKKKLKEYQRNVE